MIMKIIVSFTPIFFCHTIDIDISQSLVICHIIDISKSLVISNHFHKTNLLLSFLPVTFSHSENLSRLKKQVTVTLSVRKPSLQLCCASSTASLLVSMNANCCCLFTQSLKSCVWLLYGIGHAIHHMTF